MADFYRQLSEYCGIVIDTERHSDGIGFASIVDRISVSTTLVTFGGEGTTTPWHPSIRRIPITNPTPAYPMSLLWQNSATGHPQLAPLRDFITSNYGGNAVNAAWIPEPDRSSSSDICRTLRRYIRQSASTAEKSCAAGYLGLSRNRCSGPTS